MVWRACWEVITCLLLPRTLLITNVACCCHAGGFVPPGTTVVEKRAIAATVPVWKSENCTQCNICSFVCPHAAIRPFLSHADELASAPAGYATLQAKGHGLEEYKYRMQVSGLLPRQSRAVRHVLIDAVAQLNPTIYTGLCV